MVVLGSGVAKYHTGVFDNHFSFCSYNKGIHSKALHCVRVDPCIWGIQLKILHYVRKLVCEGC